MTNVNMLILSEFSTDKKPEPHMEREVHNAAVFLYSEIYFLTVI